MQTRLKPLLALLPLLSAAPAHAEPTLASMVVTATRQPVRIAEVLADVSVIEREEIERNGQGTITELLSRQPGIQVSTNGGPGTVTNFYLRGANPNQTKVLVDGIAINSADLSGSPLRFMPLGDVERIEILRGPAATLYGADALGGVIQIFTRRGSPGLKADGFAGYGTQDTRQASAGVAGGDARWRFRIEANHQSSDGFSAQRGARNHDADMDAYRNDGAAASLSLLPAAGHELGIALRTNAGVVHHDSGNVPADGNYDDRTRFDTEQFHFFSHNRITTDWDSQLQIGEARDEQKSFYWDAWAFPTATADASVIHTRSRQFGWQNDLRLRLGQALLAVERSEQTVGPRQDYGPDPEIANDSMLIGWSAAHGPHSWQLNARSDDHSRFGARNTHGLAYGYRIDRQWRMHVGYGTAFKAPSVYQMYMKSAWGNGNPDLQPEQSRNRELALSWDSGLHSASASYYLNRLHNLIDWVSDPATWIGSYQNVSRARLQGLTLTYGGRFGEWTLRSSYDWLEAINQETGQQLGRRARHKALLALEKDWGPLQGSVELSGVGKRYDRNDETGALPGYAVLNLTVRHALNRTLTLEGRLNNLLDKQFETARDYASPGFNAFFGIRYRPQ
jgi:vitamin B12 transporter